MTVDDPNDQVPVHIYVSGGSTGGASDVADLLLSNALIFETAFSVATGVAVLSKGATWG